MVQYRGRVLQCERGDFGLLDGVAATRLRHQGLVERVQSQSYPHGHRRRHDLRFSVSIGPDPTSTVLRDYPSRVYVILAEASEPIGDGGALPLAAATYTKGLAGRCRAPPPPPRMSEDPSPLFSTCTFPAPQNNPATPHFPNESVRPCYVRLYTPRSTAVSAQAERGVMECLGIPDSAHPFRGLHRVPV